MTGPEGVENLTDAEVADGYLRYWTLFRGDRADRLESETWFPFSEELQARTVESIDPFPMLQALLDRAADDEMGVVGLVLEDVVTLPEHWPGLEGRCRQEPRWREVLRCVCADDELVARMPPVLRETLTHDPWEFVDLTGLPEHQERPSRRRRRSARSGGTATARGDAAGSPRSGADR